MQTKIQKWGNSLGLRIPRSFAAEAQVKEGAAVDLSVEDGRLWSAPSGFASIPCTAFSEK
jgi:antitoxin MazE